MCRQARLEQRIRHHLALQDGDPELNKHSQGGIEQSKVEAYSGSIPEILIVHERAVGLKKCSELLCGCWRSFQKEHHKHPRCMQINFYDKRLENEPSKRYQPERTEKV